MKMMLNTIGIIIIGIISNVLWLQPDWIECEELKLTTPVGYDPGRKLWNDFENRDTDDNWKMANFAISTPMIHAHIPFADHTLRTEEGHFAIIDSRYTRLGNGYLEASNPYDKQTTQTNICFSFWFFFYGHYDDNLENASQLEVFLLYDSKPIKRVYRSLEDLTIRWQEALIDIPVDSMDFDKILVNGTVFRGTLAIDDLKMQMGYCISKESQVQSDFEDGSSPDMFMPDATWKVHQGSETKIHLPDHTTRTLDGHFYGVYMDSTMNPTAKILTKTNSTFDMFGSCLVFSYYLIGENVSLFYGYELTEGNIKFEQWLVQGKSASNQWFTHKETINRANWGRRTMRLIFGVQFTSAINNHAAFIDDVHLMKMSCGQESPECDFELGNYCTLEVVHPKSINDWISFESLANRDNLTTLSLNYLTGHVNGEWHVYSPRMDGPYIKHDYTMSSEYGYYFLFDQIDKQNRAIFITDRYAINTTGGTADRQNFCLEIYVVKPTEDSYIEVYQSESPGHDGSGWKLFGTSESFKDWHRLQIMARPQYSNSVDIYFFIIATTLNPRAYVAVDDFLVQPKQCPDPSNVLPTLSPPTGPTIPTTTPADHRTTPFHGFHNGKFYCNPSDSISVEKVCDQVEDCLNGLDEKECGDCSFERHDLCGYKIIGNSDDEQDQEQFQWRFSDQSKYGPNDFHVHDSMTASGRKVQTFDPDVWLMTPYIQLTYLGCFVDFYYLYNTTWPGINDRFKLKLRTSDWHTITVWQSSLEPFKPGEWYQIKVHLNRINHDFQLIFDALPLGPQPRSSISGSGSYHSIRYVRMLSCGPKTPTSPSETCYGFLCKNRVCIDKSSVCDFDDDCGDGSDEQGCDPNLMTDFQSDSGLGRWGTLYFRNWKLTEADKQSDLRLAPTFDHTTRFMSGGKYLLSNEGPGAIIDGPPMVINSGCRVSMFVMKNSKNSTLLMKLLDLQTGTTKILRTIDGFTDYFQIFYWMAGSNIQYNSIYKILLETTLTNTSDNFVDPYVAVDDISFSSSCTILDHDPINVTTTSPNDTCLGILCMDEHHKQICVVEAQICDFIPQCANGQDESQCGDCNFNEKNLCGWTQYSQSPVSVVWGVYQPASATPNRYMKQDADGNPNGGYLASAYFAHRQYFKYLRSPQINGRTSEFCQMTFQYACLERIAAAIYVDYEYILKKDLKCEENKWQPVRLDIGTHEPGFNIIVKIESFTADNIVEIDNFKLHNCSTLHQNDTEPQPIKNLDCDFETGVCGWNIGNNQTRGQWFRTNSFSLEPGIDHTSLIIPMPAKHGTWLTTQANIQMDTPSYNVLQSDRPILADPSNNGYCMRFWYYFFGIQQAKFYVNVWSADPKHPAGKTLWTRVQPVARDWSEGLIDIPRQQANFHISIVAAVSSTVIVGLDDISFSQGPCKATDPMFCDFELNLCNWKLHSGSMKITQDGVTPDHTTGTVYGHFMEQPMTQNQVISAIIQDIHHENRQQSCLSLYYYFDAGNGQDSASGYSSGNGQLSVQLFENDEWSTLKNISMVDVIGVNQQNIWTLLSVSFWMEKHASLMIQITQNQQSILIDDVRYLEHFCDSFSGACDFESDMCGWFNGKQTQNLMLWIRVTPRNTFVRRNGLPYDHTTKTDHGFYLALALDMHRAMPTESSVVLRSVLITRLQRDVAVCFRMFFFARVLSGHNGTEVMRVQLVDPQKQGKVLQEVPVLASPMGDYNEIDWVLFQMEAENLPPVYEFVIVTKYNQFIISDIGIDDITIKHERCFDHSHTPFTSTTPLPDQEKVADCDFEPLSQMCHWTYQHNIWTVTSYDKQNDPYAPAMDHTIKSSSGHYLLYKNDTNSDNPSEQWLISPRMDWDRKRCLSFWYYADGGLPFDVGQIDVMLETTGEVCLTTHLNEFRFLHTQSWQLIRLTIPFRERFNNETMRIKMNYKLFTESQNASAADYSSFAIDDIRMRPGVCGHHHDYTYTFTDGVEDLLMEQIHPPGPYKGHVINYRQAMAAKLVPDDVPKQDHTTYSIDYGYYFGFLNLNSETLNTTYISDLSIVDVPADRSQRSCIRFAYQAIGNIARSLQISISDKESYDETSLSSPLHWSNVAEKPWWTVVELDKQIDYKHSILFRMIKSFDHDSFIALDDLTVMDRQCQQPFDCDFNQDHYCSYTDYLDKMTNQAFRIYASWMANIHPDFPGPSLDHSGIKGNGYLMLTGWRSSGQSDHEQLRAKMVSGSIELREREPGNYCLSWWTWINEVEASIMINLLRFQNGKYAGFIQLATISQVVHKKWTQTMVTLNETFLKDYEEMQLLLEGEINDSRQAFIAIDDIELSKGVCPEPTFKCLNNKVLSIDQRCDFRRDCPSGWDELGCGDECTFETDMCGWEDIGFGDMDHWQKESVVHFLTVDPGHAPKFDADGDKAGHYVMMRRSDRVHSKTGHAEMALNYKYRDYYFKHSWKTCMLHFDYYTEASERFYLKSRFGDEIHNLDTFHILAPRKGSTNGGWTHVSAQIGLRWSPFLVDFNAFDDSILSVIAVDNIDFKDCQTPKPLAHGGVCPPETPVLCNQTRICIDKSDLCDGINDCGEDAEDESARKCGFEQWRRCSFESFDRCELNVGNDDDSATKWIIATGHEFEDDKVTPGYEPLIDNTRRSRNSPYALLKTKPGFSSDHSYSSTLYTPVFRTTDLNATNPCRLRFFYYWHSDLDIIKKDDLSLEVFAQYLELDDSQGEPEKSEILWKMDATRVLLQQSWTKAVINFPYWREPDFITHQSQPFRFALRAWIKKDQRARLAIDDLSYDFNCQRSGMPTSPTDNPIYTTSTTANPNSSHSRGKAGIVVMSITIIVVVAFIFGIIIHRKYYYNRSFLGRFSVDGDRDGLVMSMKSLRAKSYENK